MQLSEQENIVLERMALHMAATGDMDIGRAVDAVRNQDRELLAKLAALGDKRETLKAGDHHYDGENVIVAMRSAMARRVYKNIKARGNAGRVAPEIDGAVTITGRSDLPGRPLRYMIHGEKVAYVSFEALQLHIQGICKAGCTRCALQHLIN